MKKIWWIAILIIGLTGCNFNHERSDAYGNFEATEIIVSAMAQGEIISLGIEEGDMLEKDEVVGLIDTVDLTLKKQQLLRSIEAVRTGLETIEAQIRVQKQQKDNLLVDKNRVGKLFADGAATRKQLDDVNGAMALLDAQLAATRSQEEKIHAEIETLKIQVEQVDEALSKCFVRAPSAGTVLTKYAEPGEVAALGKPLFKIADMKNMKLKVYISGDQLPHVRLGQEVEVQIDNTKDDNSSLKGIVSWISSTAEFTPKTIQTKEERVNLVYAVKILVGNDGAIKIGMPGEVNF